MLQNIPPHPQGQETFQELLEHSIGIASDLVGSVVTGTVIAIQNDAALIDVGLKSEGRVTLKEFGAQAHQIAVGDTLEVFVERMEDKDGLIVLSREKARREAAWVELEKAFEKGENVNGQIFNRVRGGFTVDLNGATAFLPNKQLDIRLIQDVSSLMRTEQPFKILKMNRGRGNIVVSRRAVFEGIRSETRSEILSTLQENQVIEGVVKNITDYGAFIDLGGVDGLLHVTDLSWRRVHHPSEVLEVGQTLSVKVIRVNPENGRVSLGLKQLQEDPWKTAIARFPVGTKIKGHITNIQEYGAFVKLDSNIEGLIHVSEMSWSKKIIHPNKILSTSQEVDVMILEVDPEKRRIALGLKQCSENPWEKVVEDHPVGSEFTGTICNITEFGIFVSINKDLDGMIHLSDLSWEKNGEEAIKDYKVGDKIRVKVIDVDPAKERIALGVKQLTEDFFSAGMKEISKGSVVTCEIRNVTENGLEVLVNGKVPGFIRKAEISRERSEQRPDRFAVGEKVDAKVTAIDLKTRRVALSIKAREIEEEKEVLATYGSTDSGASLGDILRTALDKVKAKEQAARAEKEKEGEISFETGDPKEKKKSKAPLEEESSVSPETQEDQTLQENKHHDTTHAPLKEKKSDSSEHEVLTASADESKEGEKDEKVKMKKKTSSKKTEDNDVN